MTLALGLAWIITVGSLAGLLWWLTRLAQRRRRSKAWTDTDVSADFSLDRYQPMAGLLADDDLKFLQAQPGYRAAMGARWKRERRRLFRQYLRELKSDFQRLHAQAREMVAQSGRVCGAGRSPNEAADHFPAGDYRARVPLGAASDGNRQSGHRAFHATDRGNARGFGAAHGAADGCLEVLQQDFRFHEAFKLAFGIFEIARMDATACALVLGGVAQVQHLMK